MKHVRAEWIILTLSLTLFGCRGEVDSSNSEVTEETEGSVPALSSEGLYLEPPAVSVQAGEEVIRPVLGTYSWSVKHDDGTVVAIEVDAAAPPELTSRMEPAEVEAGSSFELFFEEEPDHYHVRIWEGTEATDEEREAFEWTREGVAVYEILAYWEQGEASYAFSVKIK